MLPDSCLERADIDQADRKRLRPDVMLDMVEMSQSECMSYSYNRHSQRHIELSTTMNSQSRADIDGSLGPQCRKVCISG